MHLLGIDYGRKHIGLAVATGPMAEPLTIIPGGSPKHVSYKLWPIIEEHQIEKIIFGKPEGKLAGETQEFFSELEKYISLPLASIDETLTTVEARRNLVEAGKKQQGVTRKIDAVAAALILQSWIDRNPEAIAPTP
jgi:putative Holliday junction resolvase